MIREYRNTDWPGVEALYKRSLAEWLDLSKYPMAVFADINAPLTENEILLSVVNANDAGEINGLIIAGGFIGNTLFVYDFYVVPELRGTAIPGRMYAMFESLAVAKGYERIIFETSQYHKDFIGLLDRTGCKLCKLQFAKELNHGRTQST